jgi:NAD(P)-dependent dehydrogenase (short-subunit alcohol dehydrogenase family)
MKVIRGRKALVTAADSPAGRSIALALASEGADVYLFGRNPQELAVTCRAAGVSGVEVISATCDLSEPAQLGAAVESVLERWGRLHILVNNTEEMHCGPTHAMTFEQWDRVLCANLIAPIALVRALLPTLARQDEAHIVNVCSLLGLIPARDVAAVQTGQFGLVGFTAALRAEYCRKGFGMTALCAGLARSSISEEDADDQRHRPPQWMYVNPDTIGAHAVLAIKKNKAIQLVSGLGRLQWWTTRLSPGLAEWLISSTHSSGRRNPENLLPRTGIPGAQPGCGAPRGNERTNGSPPRTIEP